AKPAVSSTISAPAPYVTEMPSLPVGPPAPETPAPAERRAPRGPTWKLPALPAVPGGIVGALPAVPIRIVRRQPGGETELGVPPILPDTAFPETATGNAPAR